MCYVLCNFYEFHFLYFYLAYFTFVSVLVLIMLVLLELKLIFSKFSLIFNLKVVVYVSCS